LVTSIKEFFWKELVILPKIISPIMNSICHDNSSDTQAYLDSARYCKLKVSGLQAIAVTAG
jgi:hypothetical protein